MWFSQVKPWYWAGFLVGVLYSAPALASSNFEDPRIVNQQLRTQRLQNQVRSFAPSYSNSNQICATCNSMQLSPSQRAVENSNLMDVAGLFQPSLTLANTLKYKPQEAKKDSDINWDGKGPIPYALPTASWDAARLTKLDHRFITDYWTMETGLMDSPTAPWNQVSFGMTPTVGQFLFERSTAGQNGLPFVQLPQAPVLLRL